MRRFPIKECIVKLTIHMSPYQDITGWLAQSDDDRRLEVYNREEATVFATPDAAISAAETYLVEEAARAVGWEESSPPVTYEVIRWEFNAWPIYGRRNARFNGQCRPINRRTLNGAMWCAVRVASDDGQTLWLGEANSEGVRPVVGDFKSAAIFWRKERAQVAIEVFLRRDGQSASHVSIVDLDESFYNKWP